MMRHFTRLSIAGLLAVGTLITGTFAISSAQADQPASEGKVTSKVYFDIEIEGTPAVGSRLDCLARMFPRR